MRAIWRRACTRSSRGFTGGSAWLNQPGTPGTWAKVSLSLVAVDVPLIEVEDLSVSFRAEHGHVLRAVDGVSLRLGQGEVLGLVGESGCGKTTVAKTIAGQIAPSSGTVRFDGRLLGAKRTPQDRRAIQMVFQDPYSSLNPRMSVRHVRAMSCSGSTTWCRRSPSRTVAGSHGPRRTPT